MCIVVVMHLETKYYNKERNIFNSIKFIITLQTFIIKSKHIFGKR